MAEKTDTQTGRSQSGRKRERSDDSPAGPGSGVERTVHTADTDGVDLMPDERVIENGHPGWNLWWKHITAGVLVALAGVSSADVGGIALGVLFGGGLIAYAAASRQSSRYTVTDERVRGTVGLVGSTSREYRMADVQSITTDRGLTDRLLGHGRITIKTAANDRMTFRAVPEYGRVANSIRKQQRKYERKRE
ncbi:hypothetical protein BRD17_09775 [Halobacteriales archaeon SW_7_68_16]|nr:MAG: hypothetical protein BRD17_09775 [Halobacteriales archaeon SW_7_68_16]